MRSYFGRSPCSFLGSIQASLLATSFALLAASTAAAQSFNVDCGWLSSSPLPPSSYGAAAQQPGAWNAYEGTSTLVLVDLAGQPTGVTLAFTGTAENLPDAFDLENPDWTGVEAEFMDDTLEFGQFGITDPVGSMRFSGLANGAYALHTYAMSGEFWVFTAIEVPGSVEGTLVAGGAWPGAHVQGGSHVVHHVAVTNGTLDFVFRNANTGFSYLDWNGSQLERLGGEIASACAGDGSGAACPCGNLGAAGHGCANSISAAGALLAAAGTASVAHDSLVLTATNVSNALSAIFQADQTQAGGAGVPFNDGLYCLDGALVRLATRTGSANSVTYPAIGEVPVSTRGLLGPAGGTRYYQAFYRNAADFCTPATRNQTNAVRVEWLP